MRISRGAYLTLAAAILAGCSVGQDVARDQAKSVVTPIVVEKFPGLPAETISNCVIDNATFKEILTLAAAAGTGSTTQATQTVVEIVSRPATIKCIAVNELPALLQGVV
jgi:hypothetical protein